MAEAPYDAKDVALGALANLLRLMGAVLVSGRHRDDLDNARKPCARRSAP